VTVAVLPASFDPFTCGHLDIVTRAIRLFDKVVVAVYAHPPKNVMFSLDERVQMVREAVEGLASVEVRSFDGLVVDFARSVGATVLVRGLRAVSDFEYEYQQATMNRRMHPELEVVCLFASIEHSFLSSSIVKDIAQNGGDVSSMVPAPVARRLHARFSPRARVLVSGG
jgi:pantetheine-phosphate adenylyltransferase